MASTVAMCATPATRSGDGALRAIGAVGAALSLAILSASVLLRLATVFDSSGQPLSTLPAYAEDLTRLIHRIAASGVGLLALAAVLLCWQGRPTTPEAKRAIAWIAGVTIVLAAIGPLTPGYRYAAVTVVNVVGGIVLLMACWWLREALSPARAAHPCRDALLYATFVVFLFHAGTGAATSALDARGVRWVALLHAGSAMLAAIFVGGTLWERRSCMGGKGVLNAMCALLCAQIVLGIGAVCLVPRPLWLGFAHAVISALMAGVLVSIALRTALTSASSTSHIPGKEPA
jgi:heme A synthase